MDELNIAPIDIATPMHLGVGFILGKYMRPWQAVVLSMIFERVEAWSKAQGHPIWIAPGQDSRINTVFDTIAVYAGSALSSRSLV